jgi:hypothetical protein
VDDDRASSNDGQGIGIIAGTRLIVVDQQVAAPVPDLDAELVRTTAAVDLPVEVFRPCASLDPLPHSSYNSQANDAAGAGAA